MRATACIVACSPTIASAFPSRRARKLSLSASLECEEEAVKRHSLPSIGNAAIEVLSVSSGFWVDRLALVALGRPSWWKNCSCDRQDFP